MVDVRLGGLVAEVQGSGPDVVMVHGLGGSSNSFQPQMAVLDGYSVLRPDLPGSGRSALRPGRPGLAGLATAIKECLRAQGVESARFVGHSMGTLICQYLAAAEPGLVASLTLFGAILEPLPAARDALRERADLARKDGMAPIADAVSAGSLSEATKANNPAAVAFVRESLMRQDPKGYAAHCEALSAAEAADHGRIECSTLLVAGQDDKVAPPTMARDLAGLIAGASLEIVPHCGHWLMIESPKESNAMMAAHLDRTGS